MKLENQVCSLELAKKLKELGDPQDSLWYWVRYITVINGKNTQIEWYLIDKNYLQVLEDEEYLDFEYISAFTCAELGEMLPEYCFSYKVGKKWIVANDRKDINCIGQEEMEVNARAKMRIYLLENKLIEEGR